MIGNAMAFGFSNARIRSLSGKLIGRDVLERMVRTHSLESAMSILSDTSYSEEISELSVQFAGTQLAERALSRHFSKICRKAIRMTPPRHKPTVEAVLSKWDVQDLKSVILGKLAGRQKEEIRDALTFAGSLENEELETVMNAQGPRQAVKYVSELKIGLPAAKMLADFERSGDPSQIFAELDKGYLTRLSQAALDTDDRLTKEILFADLDARNIMAAVRARADGSVDPETARSYLVPAGRAGPRDLEQLLTSKDWKPQLTRLQAADLTEALSEYSKDKSVSHIEDALQAEVSRKAEKALRTSVMTLAVIVGFVYVAEDEMRNVRRIIHGKEYGRPQELIRRSLRGGRRDD